MMDEIFDRTYQSGRAQLNDGIDTLADRLSKTVLGAFCALHRVQFDAPWSKRGRGPGCA